MMKALKRWVAIVLSIMIVVGGSPDRSVYGAGSAILDQSQETGSWNTAFNLDYKRYQTFTPAISGNLDKIDLRIAGISGSPGNILFSVYNESNLSTPLATAQASGEGWVSLDFSGSLPYLTKNTKYRMVASAEVGGLNNSYSWYQANGNPYPGGDSSSPGSDFVFRTYMIPDYSLSPAMSQVSSTQSSLVADGVSQTTITVKLKDAQGTDWTTGGSSVAITTTLGSVSSVTDNNNGTYTATLTAPTTAGTATISATVGGSAIMDTASVQFVPAAPSTANSTIQAGEVTLTANGTSQTTITVQLKDVNGNVISTGGATVGITSTLGTVSAVTDNNNGTYTATLTAPTTVGTGKISASVGGSAIAATTSVQFVPGAPSTTKSTIEAEDATLTADGVSQTTVTVKLKDEQGNALTTGGAAVGITSTLGTVSTVTDNNNGTYTATLTAPTTAGTATISATVGGSAIMGTASVQFVPGAPSTANSTIEAMDAMLTADGTSQTTVTVKLKDAQGNALTTGGAAVVITRTPGSVSLPVTDNNNGTYTATLTAPTTVGIATISASVGGSAITSTASVQFVPGAPSTANSTIQAGDADLTADGTSQTTITVKLIDAQGNALTTGGAVVAITSTLGTVSLPVTDDNNGTYTATLTAPTTAGTTTISATVGGIAIASTASVQFVPGAASTANSTIEAEDATLTADGTSQTTVTVKLKDAQGNALTTGGAAVIITTTLGSVFLPVTDNNNGTYTATLTAPTTAGTTTISATVGGTAIASTASVQFVPGAPSTANSTIEAMDATLTADGVSQTTVTVKLKDAQGNALTTGGATVVITKTPGSASLPVTDNNNGTYTAMLTAPTTVGIATISASVDDNPITATASVEFLHGDVSAVRSTVIASDKFVRADGVSQASIFVKLKDDHDNPIAGKRVLLQADVGRSVIQAVYDVTDVDGLAVFKVSNTAAESVTYTAKEEASGLTLTESVTINFTYNQPLKIELQANPVAPTFGNVTITVTASVYGDFNSVSLIKWAPGSRSVSDFDTMGVEITDHFTVHENGIYSVYAADTAGNANVSLIEVLNIVPMSGNANLADWQFTGTGGTVNFVFDPGTTSYNIQVSHSVSGLKMLLTTSDVYSTVYVNGVQVASNSVSGEYSLATGNNAFEVSVQAQDGSVKKYGLNVVRSAESSNPRPTTSTGGTTPSSPSPARTIAIRINNSEVPEIATLQIDANGTKSIDVLLDKDIIKKALDVSSATTRANLSISIEDEASKISLRLTGDAISLLADKTATIILKTRQGQYHLPLAEVVSRESNWTKAAEVQITIARGNVAGIAGLQEAANRGGFRLVGDPIHFDVTVIGQGVKREIASFDRYVERVIFLQAGVAGKASTVMAWDQQHGLRPVPTEFTEIDGQQVAAVRSMTNSAYVLVSKTSNLTDIEGHWAATEIGDMNRRMIVNGGVGERFNPDSMISRAEFAALLARALGLPMGGDQVGFRDISKTSWYEGAVAAVRAYGIMDGFKDGTFGPNREVSRQEAIVMIVRALKLADTVSVTSNTGVQDDLSVYADSNQIGSWASDDIRTAIHEGLVKGYGDELRPRQLLTRAETTVLLYRMLIKAGLING
ncbi:invasin domain 3-containing protein [Cohnella herbarum]|uniref:Attaching and effacing protein n=1 Tax=Cohnella herbarum TaxID=2728023 RepID=A0A7Z2ZNE5_9BACL|nr:invasin domain 3-containing protein [Cohnella herbarum]QJD84967.1 hypothetical protein HH215_18450 [Cohnella herbarum]